VREQTLEGGGAVVIAGRLGGEKLERDGDREDANASEF
jgi:hypothetical protein